MSHQKKKKNNTGKIVYYCPYCGNEAPYYIKRDTPFKCGYCKRAYTKEERIKEVI